MPALRTSTFQGKILPKMYDILAIVGSWLLKTNKSWIIVNFDFSFIAFQCRYRFILCVSVFKMTYLNFQDIIDKKNLNIFKTAAYCLLCWISVY